MNKKNKNKSDDKENNKIEIEYIPEEKQEEKPEGVKPQTERDEKGKEKTTEKDKKEIEKLKKKIKQYEEENKKLKEQYLREAADKDNLRKRTEKELNQNHHRHEQLR